jgi:CBS domain-containing protein
MAQETLSQYALSTFIEPFSAPTLTPDSPFGEAITWFDTHPLDFCCVLDDRQGVCGLLRRTDVVRAIERGAQPHTPVQHFMAREPVVVTPEDSSVLAALTMRDHGLTQLPIIDRHDRRLHGYVSAERLLSVLGRQQPGETSP